MRRTFRYLFSTTALVISLSACGGARGPGGTGAGVANAVSVTENSSISWQPPSTYIDNSPLPSSEIGGYQIYVGKSAEDMRLTANLTDTEFSLAKLGKGIRYIAVSCYDIQGAASGFSSWIIVNII